MRSDARRWPRATAISIALHGLFVLVMWFLSSRFGSVRVITPDDFGPRFEPGAVLPIEVAEVALVEPTVEVPGVAVSEPDERRTTVQARGSRRASSDADPPHDDRDAIGGLLGSGRGVRRVDPGALRGSRDLYDESAPGKSEGPAPAPPPGNDFQFEQEGNEWVYRHPDGSFVAFLQPDGSVDFRNKVIHVKVGSMSSVARDGEEFITLDVEHDAVGVAQLARGRDPSPRAKAQLLSATFEFRLEVAIRHHKQRLIDQLGELDEELDAIWYASDRSLAERKRLLFERWDACEEPEGRLPGFADADTSELDETRRKFASAARRKVMLFIAEVAPAGSAEAFTDAELAACNEQRVSKQVFAPYDS